MSGLLPQTRLISGSSQRLAPAWCASRSGSRPSGCWVLWEDRQKASLPSFLFGSLRSLSTQHTATGWRVSRVGESDGVFSLTRREEEEGEEEGGGGRGGGGGGVVMVVVVSGEVSEGQNATGSLAPSSFSLLLLLFSSFYSSSSLSHTQNTTEEEEDPRDRFISVISLLHHPSILPSSLPSRAAAALLSSWDNSGSEP